jgi:hypothetical protein
MGKFYPTRVFDDFIATACAARIDIFVESTAGSTFVSGLMEKNRSQSCAGTEVAISHLPVI